MFDFSVCEIKGFVDFFKECFVEIKVYFVYYLKFLKYIYVIIKGKEFVYIFRLFDIFIILFYEDVIVFYICKMADIINCDMFLKLEV